MLQQKLAISRSISIIKSELEAIRDLTKVELGADKAAIFEAHLLVLSDPELITPIEDKIKSEKVNAELH